MAEMTGTNSVCEQRARRCAVCKIDLKGRFVYVDDTTEKLTGYTKEELFGKSFLNLVTETGHAVVTQALYHRNHYETYFDSVRLEIIDRNKNPRPATVIFSLNFIAGNPVNFQVIIDLESAPNPIAADAPVDNSLRDLIHELLVIPPTDYGTEALTVLCEYLCSFRPMIYQYRGQSKLDLMSASTSTKASGQPATNSGEPTALLSQVAESGEEYSCDDSACIQRAIELLGHAPHELIARLRIDANHAFVVRLSFDEKTSEHELQRQIGESRQAIQLIERLSATSHGDHVEAVQEKPGHEHERKLQGRDTLQQAQLALTSTMQLLNRLDKLWRAH